jgi:hypothetical protein
LLVRTTATVVAQVWRNGTRQSNLARVLSGIEILPLDNDDARQVGELMAATATTDVVDAHLASLVQPGDAVLTTDPQDIGRLVAERGVTAKMIGL